MFDRFKKESSESKGKTKDKSEDELVAFFQLEKPRYSKPLRVITGFVIGAAVLDYAGQLYPDNVDDIINMLKPVGPYVSADLDDNQAHSIYVTNDMFNENDDYSPIIPAEGANVLSLSDNLDGLVATEGFSIFIDSKRLKDELASNELTVMNVTWLDDNKIVGGSNVVFGEGFKVQYLSSEQRQKAGIFEFATYNNGGLGTANYLKYSELSNDYQPIPGNGVDPRADNSFDISIKTYRQNDDGVLELINKKSTKATLASNVDCGTEVKIYSEVDLNTPQHQAVCDLMEKYSAILKSDRYIVLDSIGSSDQSEDSLRVDTNVITLTYPFQGSKEVDERIFKMVSLHEILHLGYFSADSDIFLIKRIVDAYHAVFRSTDYQMPSESKQFNGIKPTIPEVEKVWGIITESTYDGHRMGHPWDNPTEMMSSAAAVIAFRPDEFMDNFDKLNDFQKDAIRQVIREVRELIEHYNVPVSDIIPDYEQVAKHLGI